MDRSRLLPHEKRVVAEQEALSIKLKDLGSFINSPNIRKVPSEDRLLLDDQYHYMSKYNMVLLKRMEHYGES